MIDLKNIADLSEEEKLARYKELSCSEKCQTTEDHIYLSVSFGFVDKDLAPLRCWSCGEKEFDKINEDYINHDLCEFDETCKKCNSTVGHWAYGHYQP